MGSRAAAAACVLAFSLAAASCAEEQAHNPLCDLGPLDSSVVSVAGTGTSLPTAQQVDALESYVAAALAADPSLAVEGGAASAALGRLDAVVAKSGGNPGVAPDAKAVLTDASEQLRSLSDAIETRTAEGCPAA